MPELSRRAFFSVLGPAAAALAIDPERWLWEPGKKAIFDLWTPGFTGYSIDDVSRAALQAFDRHVIAAGRALRATGFNPRVFEPSW